MNDDSRRRARPLRRVLLANAVFSSICALVLFVFPQLLAGHLAGVPLVVLRVLAAGLAGFAGVLVWQATREPPRLAWALGTVAADGLWVLGTAVLLGLVGTRFSEWGLAMVLGVAVVVALMAVLQWRGIRHFIDAPDPSRGTRHRYAIRSVVDVPRSALWPVVADLGAIREHGAALAESFVEHGVSPGVGAVRRCMDVRGKRWAEEVTDWMAGELIVMRFQSEEPHFPFPMHPMYGGWTLEDLGADQTRVTIWWSFTTRPPWAAPLIVSLMDASARRDMNRVVESMAARAAADSGTSSENVAVVTG